MRVLENGEYQVVGESRTRSAEARVIALTNEKLSERVQRGEFRADLYYRFNVFPITMPPLRAHKEDVSAIAQALLTQICARHAKPAIPVLTLTPDAEDALLSYDWPGTRELRNLLERAVILAEGRPLTARLLRSILESSFAAFECEPRGPEPAPQPRLDRAFPPPARDRASERGSRKKDAAGMLGIDPRNLATTCASTVLEKCLR